MVRCRFGPCFYIFYAFLFFPGRWVGHHAWCFWLSLSDRLGMFGVWMLHNIAIRGDSVAWKNCFPDLSSSLRIIWCPLPQIVRRWATCLQLLPGACEGVGFKRLATLRPGVSMSILKPSVLPGNNAFDICFHIMIYHVLQLKWMCDCHHFRSWRSCLVRRICSFLQFVGSKWLPGTGLPLPPVRKHSGGKLFLGTKSSSSRLCIP